MEKEFIPYTESLALKELGFDEPCFGFYIGDSKLKLFTDAIWESRTNNDFIHHFMDRDVSATAPLRQQAFDWFREKHNLDGDIKQTMNCTPGESKYLTKYTYNILGNREKASSTVFKSIESKVELFYEEAELACLRKLIEIVKQK